MNRQNVTKWCREFSEGRTDVHDEHRSFRPSLTSEELLQEIEGGIRANGRVTIRQLHHIITDVSKTTIHEAVTEKLGYRKLCARWVQNETHGFRAEFHTRYAQEEDDFLDSIVTGEETWGFHHTAESKQQSLQVRQR
jgi:hypothetical protein